MKIRGTYGDKNLIGKNVYRLRKARKMKQRDLLAQLQLRGININCTSLSDLEGQNRAVTDKEIRVLMGLFCVSFEELCKTEESGLTETDS